MLWNKPQTKFQLNCYWGRGRHFRFIFQTQEVCLKSIQYFFLNFGWTDCENSEQSTISWLHRQCKVAPWPLSSRKCKHPTLSASPPLVAGSGTVCTAWLRNSTSSCKGTLYFIFRQLSVHISMQNADIVLFHIISFIQYILLLLLYLNHPTKAQGY